MSPASLELFRQALLQVLAPVPAGLGLSAPTLRVKVQAVGHTVTDAEVATELQYLWDKQLIAPIAKPISPENRMWRITATGRDYLAELGLI
jgi:hypothetical protein